MKQADPITGVLMGLYLTSFNLIAVFNLPKSLGYVAATCLGLTCLLRAGWINRLEVPRSDLRQWTCLAGVFCLIVSAGFLANIDSYGPDHTFKLFGYLSLFLFTSGVGLFCGRNILRCCVATQLIVLLGIVLITIVVNNTDPNKGRLIGPFSQSGVVGSGVHANEVGLFGMMLVILATQLGWRGIMLVTPIGLGTAYLSGCRGAMIAILIAIAVYFVAREFISNLARRNWSMVSPRMIVSCAVGLVVIGSLATASPVVSDKVLLLTDAKRGLTSGLTGRVGAWQIMIDHWWDKPLLGAGYSVVRAEGIQNQTPLDGGYFLVLAEQGVVGFAFFAFGFCILFLKTLRNITDDPQPEDLMIFVFAVTFGLINITESRITGTGSTGLGMFFLLFSILHVSSETKSATYSTEYNIGPGAMQLR